MNIDQAEQILRKKLSHITRNYTEEEEALDLILKQLRNAEAYIKATEGSAKPLVEIIEKLRKELNEYKKD